jgi:hypothetical protein
MIDLLHQLADGQDDQARQSAARGDLRAETAHRGAAVGLRMAAAVVSERFSLDRPGSSGRGLWMAPAASALAATLPARLVAA